MTKQSKLGAAIDAGISLLSGASAAFVLFAMPEGLLARAFAGIGLASASPRFQPPYAAGLRFGLAAAAGLVALAFVWSLMKGLDPKPAAAAAPAEPEKRAEPAAPRLRKADAHPDAPARRPLLAGRDLGEPLDLDSPLDLDAADALASDGSEEAAEEFVPFPEPVAEEAPRPEPKPEPVAVQPEPQPEPLPPFLVAQDPEPEPHEEPEQQRQREPAAELPRAPQPQAAAEQESGPPLEPGAGDESIVSLMRRFETGLGRKKQALADRPEAPLPTAAPLPAAPLQAASLQRAPIAAPDPEPQPAAPAAVGHRLRSAIAELQKVSSR